MADRRDARQCYGPECCNAARKGSKYCSDDCGLKLATNRILEVLPGRIKQWQAAPTVSDEKNHKELEQIRQEQQVARQVLNELDKQQKELEDLIAEGKKTNPLDEDEEEDESEDTDVQIYCVTCGHEVNMRNAVRHMERCFNKYEALTSFGSSFKTNIEGQTVFCDAYNPTQKTYCKRLRIMCPEHFKDPKVPDDEVCGCPLPPNDDQFCRTLKKKCMKHYCWEKLRRAEIDMQRLQQWFKLDELFEREQKIRFQMASRGGVLGLMLHQTIPNASDQ